MHHVSNRPWLYASVLNVFNSTTGMNAIGVKVIVRNVKVAMSSVFTDLVIFVIFGYCSCVPFSLCGFKAVFRSSFLVSLVR